MEIIVLTGIPGSGKSTFCEKYFKGEYVRVNLDTLKTRANEDKLIAECIENNISFVVDNTNVSVEKREKYIKIAKEIDCKLISYYIPTPKKIALDRNSLRTGKARVPNVAIYTMAKDLVEPSKEEGFDEMYVVDNTKDEYEVRLKYALIV